MADASEPGILLDVSATLVNQTAVSFLIRDTVRALENITAGYQLMGQMSDTPEVGQTVRSLLLQRFHASIEGAVAPRISSSDSDKPLLYFDPIYTLFGRLDSRDLVFVLDMTPVTNPEWHNPNVSKLYALAFDKILRSRCRTIHISTNTLLTMRAVLGSEGASTSVLHLYIRQLRPKAVICPHFFELGKFILFVGSLEERKNIAGLICAFEMSQIIKRGYKLVIAGGDGHGAASIRAVAERTPGVFLLGYVSDADLHHLYESASAFVYPSFLEGFGVPLLEAMAYGLPCIASMTGACPEVGGADVVYVDPFDAPAISVAMRQMIERPETSRQEMGDRLRQRAENVFSFNTYEAALRQILALSL